MMSISHCFFFGVNRLVPMCSVLSLPSLFTGIVCLLMIHVCYVTHLENNLQSVSQLTRLVKHNPCSWKMKYGVVVKLFQYADSLDAFFYGEGVLISRLFGGPAVFRF